MIRMGGPDVDLCLVLEIVVLQTQRYLPRPRVICWIPMMAAKKRPPNATKTNCLTSRRSSEGAYTVRMNFLTIPSRDGASLS